MNDSLVHSMVLTPSQTPRWDRRKLLRHWPHLHASDREAVPDSAPLLEAWRQFHSGRFREAALAGLELGGRGHWVAYKAMCVYASYLEPSEKQQQSLFQEVARRASDDCARNPSDASAHYWQGYALARYCEGISVAKALAMGIGSKIKQALETSIALQPERADAYVALAMFHADIIDKVGALIAHMTYGVRKDTGLALFTKALSLCPRSPYILVAAAQGRSMLESGTRDAGSQALYAHALRMTACDPHEALLLELARTDLSA